MRSGTPPSDFSGRGGRCGTQVLSRNSGRPLSISADSASTVAVTASAGIGAQPAGRPGIGLAAGRFAAGSGFSVARNASASSSDMSMPGTGLRPAAARSRAVPLPPMEVPRAVLMGFCGASENPDFWRGMVRIMGDRDDEWEAVKIGTRTTR